MRALLNVWFWVTSAIFSIVLAIVSRVSRSVRAALAWWRTNGPVALVVAFIALAFLYILQSRATPPKGPWLTRFVLYSLICALCGITIIRSLRRRLLG